MNNHSVSFDDIKNKYYSLRIGETIPALSIKKIRKVSNPDDPYNLAGVDYKYHIIGDDEQILTVNSWVLWNKIAKLIKQEKTIHLTLTLHHSGHKEYDVSIVK